MTEEQVDGARTSARGPVLMRRDQVDSGTTDQRLLDSRGPSDWVHTDPWRVLRIQSEFVEGFGALAELGPAIGVFGSARTPADRPGVRPGRGARPPAGRGRLRGDHRRRPGRHGGGQQGRQRGRRRQCRPRHRAALRDRAQPVGRHRASTSATSSPARRCSSSTPRASSVLPGGLGTFDELFEALTLVQTQKVTSFPVVLIGVDYWSGLLGLAARHRAGARARSPRPTSS